MNTMSNRKRKNVQKLFLSLSAGLLLLAQPVLQANDSVKAPKAASRPKWETAWKSGPMNAEETKAFMKRLARYVFDHHLKKKADSPQRGMIYEYMNPSRVGQYDQYVQGEGLDTMHDGAWFCVALVNAYRATGDPFYKEFLTQWILPFYLKMLNHSDELFTTQGAVARPGAPPWGKAWAFQEGEKGFVPYWWDDGFSVSLERSRDKNPLPIRPSRDNLHGKPNPHFLLDGYSLGMSNHMAQDLGLMLQLSWLLLRDSQKPAEKKLAREIAEAARNLYECRLRHFGFIPMCAAPWALAGNQTNLLKRLPDPRHQRLWNPSNHYVQAVVDVRPGRRVVTPGFTDDLQFLYYLGIARSGGELPKPLAFKIVYDSCTQPLLFRMYCDDWDVPPGINRFDLAPLFFIDGKPAAYRSQSKGPGKRPHPLGSRFGPQNMVCCGWALQILQAYPGLWEERHQRIPRRNLDERRKELLYLRLSEADLRKWLEKELGGGLKTWQAVFEEKGYIPTALNASPSWERFSDSGGYAHLISAGAQWLLYLEKKRDWEQHGIPQLLKPQ